MLNKKPRIPAPVQIPEHVSFLQGFAHHLVAQTVSPHTRNAYLSDLIQMAELSKNPLPDWSSDDIHETLLCLTQMGKSPRSIARSTSFRTRLISLATFSPARAAASRRASSALGNSVIPVSPSSRSRRPAATRRPARCPESRACWVAAR